MFSLRRKFYKQKGAQNYKFIARKNAQQDIETFFWAATGSLVSFSQTAAKEFQFEKKNFFQAL